MSIPKSIEGIKCFNKKTNAFGRRNIQTKKELNEKAILSMSNTKNSMILLGIVQKKKKKHIYVCIFKNNEKRANDGI